MTENTGQAVVLVLPFHLVGDRFFLVHCGVCEVGWPVSCLGNLVCSLISPLEHIMVKEMILHSLVLTCYALRFC